MGSLLIKAEGLETAHIQVKDRDSAVLGFYRMRGVAERHADIFYALQEVYETSYSYGDFYPGFLNMPWEVFSQQESLKGICETTYELMVSFSQCPGMETLQTETDFHSKAEPRACSGYSHPHNRVNYVSNIQDWEEWRRQWFLLHPENIDWSKTDNAWISCPGKVRAIARRELFLKKVEDFKNGGDDENTAYCKARSIVDKIPDTTIVVEFHSQVMRQKGPEMPAYAERIGTEVCEANYYRFESELTDLERRRAGNSLRKIFSIQNGLGNLQFLSIDFAHGMFEGLDEHGDHHGEFHFDGSFNSVAEEDHSFKCMDEWHRMTGR